MPFLFRWIDDFAIKVSPQNHEGRKKHKVGIVFEKGLANKTYALQPGQQKNPPTFVEGFEYGQFE